MTTIELAQLNPSARRTMHGYERLAGLMANDKGLSIFRSFKKLNAKNLLYLQAEIVNVQTELEGIIEADETSQDEDREKFSTSVCFLKEGIESGSEQWAKVLELRELLDKYNTAALQYAQILRLKRPHDTDRDVFKTWLSQNAFCSTIAEFNQWFGEEGVNDEENERDLVTLCGRYENVDSLTRWVFRVLVPWFHERVGVRRTKEKDIEAGTVYYDDEKIIRATRVTSTITSSVIPASSMLVLYLVDHMVWRLIIIVLYNIGFSIILGLLAKARRVEVFAASTA
ncbi:hypothetical protein ASPCAL01762 [Aspergillus calidoustus]|uniref:DUF6594 domain-containing protein n=1 Tax=Aspergillus calidoustus TaxID=454130 RepID=A0A0U5GKG2_ASPCI|nr:hypothetical protein ASPCAL01762 [Aspergillus calidoustus]